SRIRSSRQRPAPSPAWRSGPRFAAPLKSAGCPEIGRLRGVIAAIPRRYGRVVMAPEYEQDEQGGSWSMTRDPGGKRRQPAQDVRLGLRPDERAHRAASEAWPPERVVCWRPAP